MSHQNQLTPIADRFSSHDNLEIPTWPISMGSGNHTDRRVGARGQFSRRMKTPRGSKNTVFVGWVGGGRA